MQLAVVAVGVQVVAAAAAAAIELVPFDYVVVAELVARYVWS